MRTRTDLRNRWIALSNNPGIFDNTIAPRHSEPHRHYHTLDHVTSCLEVLDQTKTINREYRPLVEYALFFHDIVYDPHRDDNEISSVGVWLHSARGLKLDRLDIIDVVDCILKTDHKYSDFDELSSYVVDIDLSILGSAPEVFDIYEGQIRQEYKHVAGAMYARGRSQVLQEFLARETVFQTEEFQEKYEEKARRNLKRSLERLSGVVRAASV